MARYNTVYQTTSTSGSQTISAPVQGLTTTITGSSGVTLTVPNPVQYVGYTQTYFNATSGNITLSTPSGIFTGPASSGTTSQTVPANTTMTITADGTNYVIANIEGGVLVATTVTASGAAQFNSTVTASSAFTPTNTYDLITKTYLETKYGQPWSYQGSSFTATAGGRYFCNGGITVTLPASPTIGDAVHIIDYNGNFNSSNLTVAQGGGIYIMRQNTSMTVSTAGAAFQLVYSGATNPGWLVAQGI